MCTFPFHSHYFFRNDLIKIRKRPVANDLQVCFHLILYNDIESAQTQKRMEFGAPTMKLMVGASKSINF